MRSLIRLLVRLLILLAVGLLLILVALAHRHSGRRVSCRRCRLLVLLLRRCVLVSLLILGGWGVALTIGVFLRCRLGILCIPVLIRLGLTVPTGRGLRLRG